MKRLAWGSVFVAVLGAGLLLAWPPGPSAARPDPTPVALVPPEPAPSRPVPADASPPASASPGAFSRAEPTFEEREAFAAGVKRRIAERQGAAGQRRAARAERREARRLERLEHARALRERREGRPRPDPTSVVLDFVAEPPEDGESP
jgi:hypothetical protein